MIKGLRRSLKGEKRASSNSSTRISTNGNLKSAIATIPPKKIIRALYDYTSQGPGELTFRKGDFLYVVGHENDEDWYEACDPPSNLRGMVPVSYFEVVSRQETINTIPLADARRQSHASDPKKNSGFSDVSVTVNNSPSSSTRGSHKEPGTSPLYGVVLYNFEAERQDELQASAGESIIVIAQSNEEWFVAKPIGRLGGPGLIPVSYVQIREVGSDKPVDDIQEAIRRAGVPKVEEWKRMAAEYKASSIPLGRFEDDASTRMSRQLTAMNLNGPAPAGFGGLTVAAGPGPELAKRVSSSPYVVSASVDRYAFDGGRYWYLVVVQLSNGYWRNLCRYYQDFYDFQIKLLDEFPDEAGRTGRQRILPFMPGPLTYVNDSISSQRRANLDDYVRNLIMMPSHISRSLIVQQLFAIRTGDLETPHQTNAMPQPPLTTRESRVSGYDDSQRTSRTSAASYVEGDGRYYAEQVQVTKVRPSSNSHSRMASESTVTAVMVDPDEHEQHTRQMSRDGYEHEVHDHTVEVHDQPVDNHAGEREQVGHSRNNSNIPPEFREHNYQVSQPTTEEYVSAHSKQLSMPISKDHGSSVTPTPSSPRTVRDSLNPSVKETSPGQAVTSNRVSPQVSSLSAKSASPAKSDSVIKVKVHHGDDLIAIRVPANITFEGLLERICERLQLSTVTLMYKEDTSGSLQELRDDDDLAEALGMKNKLVLYAK